MTSSELARTWGVSPSYVARLVKRGLPLTSLSAADSWRLANLQKPPRSESGSALVSAEVKAPTAAGADDEDSTHARLKRSHQAERLAFDLLKQLAEGGNAIAMRAGVHAWGEAKKRVSEAELEHAKHQLATRELVSMSEVMETFAEHLGGIRALMDALPSMICFRANPSDPDLAKQSIAEGVDQILRNISNAERVAFPTPAKVFEGK